MHSSVIINELKHHRAIEKDLDTLVSNVLKYLITDRALPEKNLHHSLSGDWSGYRECHIKPDLLLIYKKPDQFTLRLARLGSHSDLFD